MTRLGTLYGVGVGPGDPELLTLRAARVLGTVRTVFTAASPKNDYSTAHDIARPHLPEGVRTVRLDFPMTRDTTLLRAAWEANAAAVREHLQAGDGAFLTLGDPMTYSTFGYLLRVLCEDGGERPPVDVVPGITSYQAAAARTQTVLTESGENLLVMSGVCDAARLRAQLDVADNAVILKAYKNFREIRETLEDLGLAEKSLFVTKVGQEDERIFRSLREAPDKPHYFSLVLVKK